jgi:hypothetical protein
MNEVPPSQDPDDEADDLYRRASAVDPSRPSESVRRKVLEHAAQLAAERTATAERAATAERTATKGPARIGFARWPYRSSWRPAIFGTLAAAALAGLLFAPEFLMPRGPGTTLLPDQGSLQKAVPAPEAPAAAAPAPARLAAPQAPAGQAPATQAPTAQVLAAQVPAATVAPTAPPPRTPYVADEPSVPASREQAQSMLKPRASVRNAAPVADSAAPIAAKNAPAPVQGMNNTQSIAGAVGGVPAEAGRARAGASTMTDIAAAPLAAPAARESTERTEVTAARREDPAAELRRAAEIGDVAKLQTVLNRQPESVVDARDEEGRTALMLATLHGRAHAVNVLLAHGADPNVADARGTTPLQAALAGHQTAIAAALQLAGARAQ